MRFAVLAVFAACLSFAAPCEAFAAPSAVKTQKAVKSKKTKKPAKVQKKTAAPKEDSPEQKKKKEQDARFLPAENALYAFDLQKALPELAVLCEQKYLRACSLLGFAYSAGRYGIKRDAETGEKWYQKCADEEKNFFCSNELGLLAYRAGDYQKALSRYEAGAKGANAKAQYLLGKMYLDGKGTAVNEERAVMWLRRAAHNAKKPEKQAQCLMAQLSYYGIGMKQSLKDTAYWLKKCDNAFIRAQQYLYGHGVEKNPDKAKAILKTAGLTEALNDWDDFLLKGKPSVSVASTRDNAIPEDCAVQEFVFGAGRKNPQIETYAVKIFHKNYYRTFDVKDGYSEKNADFSDRTFEACGTTFYTTKENLRLFNKSLKGGAVIKIGKYARSCAKAQITGVCDLNLTWSETP